MTDASNRLRCLPDEGKSGRPDAISRDLIGGGRVSRLSDDGSPEMASSRTNVSGVSPELQVDVVDVSVTSFDKTGIAGQRRLAPAA